MIIKRNISAELARLCKSYPIVTITGPRQSGKTTLVKSLFPQKPYFTFEDPDTRHLVLADPRSFLKKIKNGAVLDEVQRVPDILSYLQGEVDKDRKPGRFILTGSQQLNLVENVTQSLAGRTSLLKLLPFSIDEVHKISKKQFDTDDYLFRGFYPGVYSNKLDPTKAYRNYYETYIERDLRQLINIKDLHLFQKFVKLCAGRIGNIFVASHLAVEVGVSVPTIQKWVSLLEASFIVFFLYPYYENIGKRVIKAPKLYFYDTGIASYLLGLENITQIERDPLRGALFENLVILELVKARFSKGLDHNLYFYRDNHQNEVDVIYKYGSVLVPVEIKSAETFDDNFLKGLKYFKKVIPRAVKKGFLIYAGNTEQSINGINLINYKNTSCVIKP
ncbi:MAG: AAA family ATPase [Elusimicrobia bacterium RIFOXYA2_FULL_39_19]|nr:MAG: AAA family ATPase [Elusimicrobia bacterium RIFOXYA2_FULL_39_19]